MTVLSKTLGRSPWSLSFEMLLSTKDTKAKFILVYV